MREQLLEQLRKHYQPDRVSKLEPEFLGFEEDMIDLKDLELIVNILQRDSKLIDNPYNSCILYSCGLSNEFDFVEARCKTKGGSSPD